MRITAPNGALILCAVAFGCIQLGLNAARADSHLSINLLNIRIVKELHDVVPLHPRELAFLEPRAVRPDLVAFADLAGAAHQCRVSAGVALAAGAPERALSALNGCANDRVVEVFRAYAQAMLGRQGEARSTFRDIPNIASHLFTGGLQEHRQGNLRGAAWLLAEALGQDPSSQHIGDANRALAYEYLVQDLDRTNQREAAISWARRWVEATPLNFRASTVLAGEYIRQGAFDQAFSVLSHIEPLGGRKDFLFSAQLGQVYASRGEWPLAIKEYREWWVHAQDVEWARPYSAWYLGSALHREGRVDEARPFLEVVRNSEYPVLRDRADALLSQR
jgi:tetratricopeptide (TPR) repeat protein